MAYHLKYVSIATLHVATTQSNVNLKKCALFKCLSAGQCIHLLLKYWSILQMCNTYFKSVKTLCLFVCTDNKIMKAKTMRFLPSRSL